MLKPLGHRVLIQPDEQPTQTDSGLVLPQDQSYIPCAGTVIAVGDGPERDQRIRLSVIARCMSIVEELAEMSVRDPGDYLTELRRYRNDVERVDSPIAVGARVAYPIDAGLRLTEDGTAYILCNEDDVAVVVEDAEQAA